MIVKWWHKKGHIIASDRYEGFGLKINLANLILVNVVVQRVSRSVENQADVGYSGFVNFLLHDVQNVGN